MAKEAPKKTIIDVKQPGAAPASPTSKSIIVNNRALLKDPMMAEGNPPKEAAKEEAETKPAEAVKPEAPPKEAEPKEESKVKQGGERVLALDSDGQAVKEAKPAEPAKTKETEAAAPPAEAKPAANEAKPEEPADEEPAEKEPAEKEAADQKAKTESDKKAEAEKQQRAAEVSKLVESGKYFLPINKVEKRKAKQATVLGVVLAILLLLAWADIALDAGLVKISGVKAPTHFFSN